MVRRWNEEDERKKMNWLDGKKMKWRRWKDDKKLRRYKEQDERMKMNWSDEIMRRYDKKMK